MSQSEQQKIVEFNLTALIYCMSDEPRLFRLNNGNVEWAEPKRFGKPKWHVLPMKKVSYNE